MARILFVCTANRIRSPIAEAALRRAVGSSDVSVESAGTMGTPTREVPEAMIAAQRLGLDLSRHVPRALADLDLDVFDLIIGFELSHVASAVVEARVDPAKTFTLREIVRLADLAGPEAGGNAELALRAVVKAANRSRGASPTFDPDDAIEDPIGRGQAAADRCAQEIDSLCRALARLVWNRR